MLMRVSEGWRPAKWSILAPDQVLFLQFLQFQGACVFFWDYEQWTNALKCPASPPVDTTLRDGRYCLGMSIEMLKCYPLNSQDRSASKLKNWDSSSSRMMKYLWVPLLKL